MTGENKSLLDGMRVKEEGFSSRSKDTAERLFVCGFCPKCGGPIFGPESVSIAENPVVKYSCNCRAGT